MLKATNKRTKDPDPFLAALKAVLKLMSETPLFLTVLSSDIMSFYGNTNVLKRLVALKASRILEFVLNLPLYILVDNLIKVSIQIPEQMLFVVYEDPPQFIVHLLWN